MAHHLNRLTDRTAKALSKVGRHADGGGLYLSISPNGGRRWVFLFRWHGKPTEMGLGAAKAVKLARARELAAIARGQVAEGVNPLTVRVAPKVLTFGEVADELIEAMKPSWRNDKHRDQWVMTLRDYAKPLRPLMVSEVDTPAVLEVLKPLWTAKPETASRLRGRIERVMDAAKARGMRTGENPARWRGHLDRLLPPRKTLSRGHHAAMPYDAVPAFMAALRAREGSAALALEFTVLTAARSGETRGATWSEIDFKRSLWTVPAARMKGGREHRVPLSTAAIAVLKRAGEGEGAKPVFPGSKPGAGLSVMAMDMLLRRMKVEDTVHGFRSAFRDWAAETTPFPNEVCEAALAHALRNKVEAAYRRGDVFEKRKKLMEAWASYCARPAGANVIKMRKKA